MRHRPDSCCTRSWRGSPSSTAANLATEALRGMTQKAKTGGTPGKAPIGYLNTRRRIDGREVRVVAVDPDRAPHIQWAFEAYATGEYTIRTLAEALAARGVASDWGARRGRPLANSYVAKLLSNRYYLGYVTFNGTEYKGNHQSLITQAVFDQVQQTLEAHDVSGEKQRAHPHYLKGTIYCGQCQRRLSFTLAKGRYPYFFCLGRHQRQTICQQPYLDVDAAEAAVERFWRTVRLPAGIKQTIQDGLRIELDTQNDRAQPEIRRARERVEQLSQERRRLARGVVSGSIPDDLAREEQERIQRDLDQAKRILETSEMVYEHIQGTLERALELLERVDEVYRLGSPRIRQMLNQCFFSRVLLDGEQDGPQVTGSTLREPWTTLLARDFQARMRHHTRNPDHDLLGRGSIMKTLVPPAGFEPATPALGDRSKVLVTAFDLRKPGPAVTATDPVCRWLIARLLPVDHGGRTLVVEGPCSGEKAAADGFGVHCVSDHAVVLPWPAGGGFFAVPGVMQPFCGRWRP
jgi:site-specific DNA recombinase